MTTRAKRTPAATRDARSTDVDAIIADSPDWRGATLARLRDLIHAADPAIVETAKWKKPSDPLGAAVFEHDGIVCLLIRLKERSTKATSSMRPPSRRSSAPACNAGRRVGLAGPHVSSRLPHF
jgi:hypothetical protein